MMKCIILRPGHSRGSNPRKTVKYPLVGPHPITRLHHGPPNCHQLYSSDLSQRWSNGRGQLFGQFWTQMSFAEQRLSGVQTDPKKSEWCQLWWLWISTSPRWKVCPGVCWGWRQQWRILQSTQLLLGIQSCQVSQLQHNQPPADRDSSKSQPYPHSTIIKH